MAISKYDQFDFLIDIVPRDEIKPTKKEMEVTAPTKSTPVPEVFYVQMPQQQQQQHQQQQSITVPSSLTQSPQTQTIQLQNGLQATQQPQQNIILQSPTQQQPVPTSLIQLSNPNQQIQLVQQVMGPNGEISQIPVSIQLFILVIMLTLCCFRFK